MEFLEQKTITKFRNTLFETFDEVEAGKIQLITHKNGKKIALVPFGKIEEMNNQIIMHRNLAIGYAEALRGEGVSSVELKKKFKDKESSLREKYG
jgi:hypothetical protein